MKKGHTGILTSEHAAGEEDAIAPSPCATGHKLSSLNSKTNRLLASMPRTICSHIFSGLDLIELRTGHVLFDNGEHHPYVYFPIDCIVSLQQVMQNGGLAEIGIVGWEGMVGIPTFMDNGSFCTRAIVQHAGHAYRLDNRLLIAAFDYDPEIRGLLLQYTRTLLKQVSQTAACNRYHRLEQQLCRWMLLMLDRVPGRNQLPFTQEMISNTLGVCREGITAAAMKVQAAGIIEYSRGRITVLDKPGLEKRTCECYEKIRIETDHPLLGMHAI